MIEDANTKMTGHILIADKMSGEVVLDHWNSINPEAMSLALAQSLGRINVGGVYVGPIEYMCFGNGGTSVNGVGVITYLDKNITGLNASLYNQTYEKIVDQNNPLNTDPSENYMAVSHVSGNLFSDLTINCELNFGEPSDQLPIDNNTSSYTYNFDEIGLRSYSGNLITYTNFSPVAKASNRIFQISYTLRISLI